MSVKRVFVEKKPEFAVQARELCDEIESYLGIAGVTGVRVLVRYDIENLSEDVYREALGTIFSEPPVDEVFEGDFVHGADDAVFSVEYLPGQFDQRADSAEQCVKLLKETEEPVIKTATTYVISGSLTKEELDAVKAFCINPVDSREASETIPETLVSVFEKPEDVAVFEGFASMDEAALKELYGSLNLAMTFKDFLHIQAYYKNEEKRDPSVTEIRVLDTYWSDHCRHTTFGTVLDDVEIADANVQAAFDRYLELRHELGRDEKPVCLMDMGTIGAKWLKKEGILTGLDESEEINACTIKCKVDVDGEEQDWLYLFKNETHNHPTEIEPFGGAATCVGGAIRDPLSGRSYVYQAMRVTGAADPTVPVADTIPGKLPQRKLVTTAAAGYSSYGNQIGLATGQVHELYHPGYAAKRMEIGAVVGATPADHVRRETPAPGDVVVLCGSLPQELPAGWYRDLTAECRKKGAAVYLDTAGEPLILGITAKPDCIKPNREELEPLYGYRLATTESLAEAAWQLLHRGVGQVVVSLGAQGALLATREAVLFAAAPTVTALNTTGAGDTMTAALIYARLHGLTPEETLRFAVAAATAKVVRAGTQPPVMSDIGALLPQVEVRSI